MTSYLLAKYQEQQIKEKVIDNRSQRITEVLEKDSRKAGNWSTESWKAEQLLVSHGNRCTEDRRVIRAEARRLSVDALPGCSMKLLTKGSLLKRQNRNMQAKAFLLSPDLWLYAIKILKPTIKQFDNSAEDRLERVQPSTTPKG